MRGLPQGYDPFYTDAFGHTSPVIRRPDVQPSKVTMQFKGWVFDPRLRYFTFVWFNNNQGDSTQTAIGGSLSWIFSNAITVGAGIAALPTSGRSVRHLRRRIQVDAYG